MGTKVSSSKRGGRCSKCGRKAKKRSDFCRPCVLGLPVEPWPRPNRVPSEGSSLSSVGGTVTIDVDLLEMGKSSRSYRDKMGGINSTWSVRQLTLLGVQHPLVKGWKHRLYGTVVTREVAIQFILLKNAHLKNQMVD